MDRRKWLLRLIPVRLIIFSVFVAIELSQDAQFGLADHRRDMLTLLGGVYVLSACWYGLIRVNRNFASQALAQIAVDLFLITWTVNRTGGLDSSFTSLYFLEIVMSSILLKRRGAFVTATASSVIHYAHMTLAYFDQIPHTGAIPEMSRLQYLISLTIFGFCAVGYLSNHLAETIRSTGVQLEKSTGQVAFLRAFSDRIVDSMGSGLITTDLEGRIYLFNRAAEGITGLRSDEAGSQTVWQVFPGMVSHLQAGRFELSTPRHDGKEIYLRFTVTPVMIDEKNTAGFVWSFDDLTELRTLERQMRQKEQMATIGVMSAGIAHEIRNPLASISGSFNMLRSDLQLDEDQNRLMNIISRETERLNRIITDFLSYARPLAPAREPIDLSRLIDETASLMRNSPELLANHQIEMQLQPVRVRVDESMMRQVFYNLASNAFKAMPDGGTLTVSLEPRNGGAQIRFSDTGIGLSEEEMKQLFVPFTSSFRNGVGLGLPIVYQIVNAHNGTIVARSRKGAGTTFVIDL